MKLLILVTFAAAMWLLYQIIAWGTETFGLAFPGLALALELLLARAYDRRRSPLS